MKSLTRRDFVRRSMAAGAAVTAATSSATASQTATPADGTIKIIAISCSPRKGKTTTTALGICLEAAKMVSNRIETELIELADFRIPGNVAAGVPLQAGEQDDFPKLIPRLTDAKVGGIIIGTPVYFGNMSSLCKAFLDRCIALYQPDFALSGKVGGVVAVGGSRNGGQEATIQSVQMALFCHEMIVVGNGRPSSRLGGTVWSGTKGGVLEDEFGMTTTKALGRHVAEVALRLAGTA